MKPTSVAFNCFQHLRASLASSLRSPHLAGRRPLFGLGAACLWVPWLLGSAPAAAAVIFTNDTVITYSDPTYDGQEIVVTNCTVTVDGAHSFLEVRVLNGGILTHTAAPNAVLASNDTTVVYAGLNLVVTNNVEIEIGGAINANGNGYGAGLGWAPGLAS